MRDTRARSRGHEFDDENIEQFWLRAAAEPREPDGFLYWLKTPGDEMSYASQPVVDGKRSNTLVTLSDDEAHAWIDRNHVPQAVRAQLRWLA